MSDIHALALVIGLIFLFGGLLVFWVFFMDGIGPRSAGEDEPTGRGLTWMELSRIQRELGVVLPAGYRSFLCGQRDREQVDEASVWSNADGIIAATKDYREGAHGNSPWPGNWLCIGDEADACPYALDCTSGEVRRTDKGNPVKEPLETHASFDALLVHLRQQAATGR